MKIYVLIESAECRPHGSCDTVIAVSTNKNLIFDKATKLSHRAVNSISSWRDDVYWIHIFDNKTGKEIDHLEFDSNGRREGTFGKIVRSRGSRDEKIIDSWT